jgi:hypothetical protein
MSDYSTTKSYVLLSAGTTATTLVSTLYDHFLAAPGLWRIKTGVAGDSDGFIIEPKTPVTGYNIGASIRRNSTTDIRVQVDEGNGFTARGSAAGAATGASALAMSEGTLPMTGIASAVVAISETPDGVIVLFYTTLLANVAQVIYIGRGANPDRAVYREAPLLFNGIVCMLGSPTWQPVAAGFIGGPSSASRTRSNGGTRALYAVSTAPANSPIPNSPGSPVEIITAPNIGVYHDASTNFSEMGSLRYIGRAATARTNRVVIQHPTEQEAWLHISDATYETLSSKNVITWEKGVPGPV